MKIFKNFFLQKLIFMKLFFLVTHIYYVYYNNLILYLNIKINFATYLKFISYKSFTMRYIFLKIIYFLIKANIISAKTRQLCYNFAIKNPNILKKYFFLLKYTKRFKSTNNQLLNQKHYRSKKKILILYNNKLKPMKIIHWSRAVMWYYHFFYNKIYLILITSKGSYFLKPLVWGLHLKTWFSCYWLYLLSEIQLPLGFYCIIKYFTLNYFYCNLHYNNMFYAQSSGTFLKILFFNKFQSTAIIKLPSSQIVTFSTNSYLYVGRNSNIFVKKIVQGGYFSRLISPKKINFHTRGISQNPVDHPNGGRTNTKKPFKTPWGKIAKHKK